MSREATPQQPKPRLTKLRAIRSRDPTWDEVQRQASRFVGVIRRRNRLSFFAMVLPPLP
jgi:hypothetical protein